MSHEMETMAYVGAKPWHGLGVDLGNVEISPQELLEVAGLNWAARCIPTFFEFEGARKFNERFACIRDTDGAVLSPSVSKHWQPIQNSDALGFFNRFCEAGHLKMETAGSLKGGKHIWALAKVAEPFTIGGHDLHDGYINFHNPHQAGYGIVIQSCFIRTVCWNTLSANLENANGKLGFVYRQNHTQKFDVDMVHAQIGMLRENMANYKETAEFLVSKAMTTDQATEYFRTLYPVNDNGVSLNAKTLDAILETQPGADLGRGTWWQGFNAVTYFVDHVHGKNADNRMRSAWYGAGRVTKERALTTALKLAA